MTFVNLYKPPASPAVETCGPDPYDINYACPLPPSLETPRVRLTPFIPSQHAAAYFACTARYPEVDLFQYMPMDFPTPDDLLRWIETAIRADPQSILFAIIDKTAPDAEHPALSGSVAGLIGLLGASTHKLSAEMGPVVVLPPFQRTFVSTHAMGLALRYCFQRPEAEAPGLGFARVQWSAHPGNAASLRAAARMGFRVEGQLRWCGLLADGEGKLKRDRDGAGKIMVLFAVCWDDWEDGVQEQVHRQMERVA